ncbi:MAG: NAD-dependent epimerase/dehydratase family protein [Armatimonadetes bacterium]|nr:NAD-dependent epimerase/dehydratase family protein [Anaerolineae bacterium]
MRTKVILITGANGEVGHGLIKQLRQHKALPIIVLDVRGLDPAMNAFVDTTIVGDILDTGLLDMLTSEYEIDTVYHLAALLSTHSEFRPESAHRVNVQGTINLMQLAIDQARWRSEAVKFIFPSSVAVYGMPDLATKATAAPVSEDQYLMPTTMYGCNKLYCEHLGRYYAAHYRQLAAEPDRFGIDFRCVRFPGLISATTMPSGGTSDYAPEMLHAAAKGEAYAAFVRPDTAMPFMTMPDAIQALLQLADAPREQLKRPVYNVTSFSLSAEQVAQRVVDAFPRAELSYEPSTGRQGIVDSWPAAMDDSAARREWGWAPQYDVDAAFDDYLLPIIRQQYGKRTV